MSQSLFKTPLPCRTNIALRINSDHLQVLMRVAERMRVEHKRPLAANFKCVSPGAADAIKYLLQRSAEPEIFDLLFSDHKPQNS
jgi:hypothetical protein